MGFSETEPSIAAVVGSLDAYCARYAAEVLLQGHRVEILQARAWPAARARNPTLNPTLSLQDVLAHATTLDPNSGIRAQSSADRELQRRRAMRIWPAGGTHARPRERAAPAGESRPAREPSLSRGAAPRAGPQGHGQEAAAGVLPRQRQQEARAPGLLPRRRVRGPGARAAARTGAVAQAAVYEEDVLGEGCICLSSLYCAGVQRPLLFAAAPAAPAASARQAGTGVSSRANALRCPWLPLPRRQPPVPTRAGPPRARSSRRCSWWRSRRSRPRARSWATRRARSTRRPSPLVRPRTRLRALGFRGLLLLCAVGRAPPVGQASMRGPGRSAAGVVLPVLQRSACLQARGVQGCPELRGRQVD